MRYRVNRWFKAKKGFKSMSSQKLTVLCGSCKCAVKTVPDPKANDKVACPRCNRTDRFDKVMDSVREHIVYLTQQSMAKRLAASTRGNRFVKFKADQPRHRSFRWISDYRG